MRDCIAFHFLGHDSQKLNALLEKSDEGQVIWADSAYTGEKQDATLKKYKVTGEINEKGISKNPLTEIQKENNRKKSKTRARVEHVFGFMTQNMGRMTIRSIGMARAKGFMGLRNLTYNLFRIEQLVRCCGERAPKWA